MGKKRTQKDRLYLTATEYQQSEHGFKDSNASTSSSSSLKHQSTPFTRCALTLREWKPDAVCTTSHGYYSFDLLSVVPYISKYHQHPILHTPLSIKDLIKLHYTRNHDQQYVDPVTMEVLTEKSHIVAIVTTGNVYLYDTIHQLCIKSKSMYDLIDNTPFQLNDIITIQNPQQPVPTITLPLKPDNTSITSSSSSSAAAVADTSSSKRMKPTITTFTSSTSASTLIPISSASFTSTASNLKTSKNTQSHADTAQRESMYKRFRTSKEHRGKKGYCTIYIKDLGPIDLQIHCDLVPSIAHNFLTLVARGVYQNTEFHRLIEGFMIQGGRHHDGEYYDSAAYGGVINDEYYDVLTHNKRGVVAMANHGKNTNRQQFYITFNAVPHLDKIHSVFADVVGERSTATLSRLERIPTDSNDIPLQPIVIDRIDIHACPFDEELNGAAASSSSSTAISMRDGSVSDGNSSVDKNVTGAFYSNPANMSSSEATTKGGTIAMNVMTKQKTDHRPTRNVNNVNSGSTNPSKLYSYDTW